MKAESDLLECGETVWLDTSSPDSVIAFKRALKGKELLFLGNTKNCETDIEAELIADKKCILHNGEHKIENGVLQLGPYEYVVLG